MPRPTARSSSATTRRWAASRASRRSSTSARGRIGLMCELKSPWRYRRHDVVARTVALLPEDAVVVSFEPRALRPGARAADAAARRPRRLDPAAAARFAWGSRLLGSRARGAAGSRWRGALGLGRPSTPSTMRGADARSSSPLGVDGIFTDRPDLLLGRCCSRLSSRALVSREARARPSCPTGIRVGARRRDVGGHSSSPEPSPSAASPGRGTCARRPRRR